MNPAKFKCNFAFIDVTTGRKMLASRVVRAKGKGGIPVVISGRITAIHSHDAGESVEFEVVVDTISETERVK